MRYWRRFFIIEREKAAASTVEFLLCTEFENELYAEFRLLAE